MARRPKQHSPFRLALGAVNAVFLLWVVVSHSGAIFGFLVDAVQGVLYALLGVVIIGAGAAAFIFSMLTPRRGR